MESTCVRLNAEIPPALEPRCSRVTVGHAVTVTRPVSGILVTRERTSTCVKLFTLTLILPLLSFNRTQKSMDTRSFDTLESLLEYTLRVTVLGSMIQGARTLILTALNNAKTLVLRSVGA
jgi:hypothetical protein